MFCHLSIFWMAILPHLTIFAILAPFIAFLHLFLFALSVLWFLYCKNALSAIYTCNHPLYVLSLKAFFVFLGFLALLHSISCWHISRMGVNDIKTKAYIWRLETLAGLILHPHRWLPSTCICQSNGGPHSEEPVKTRWWGFPRIRPDLASHSAKKENGN